MIQYNFYNPTCLLFGSDSIDKLGKRIADFGCSKVLLLAGGGSIKKNGVYDRVKKALAANQIESAEVWGVQANPTLDKVREAIELAKSYGADAILAVGGGSTIDSAKATAAGVYADDIWQVFEHKEKIKRALPIFTVLTLSATASEMNCNAVITNELENKKYGTGHPLLYPKVSAIDPAVQTSLPWQQTVNGALDAMAHIMEFYFIGTDEETVIALSESLLSSIIKAMAKLKENGNDVTARSNLAWAATLALNGMSGAGLKGGDWACHAISHSISALYPEIAHGAALGVIFPAWMEYVSDEEINIHQFNRFSRAVFGRIDIEEGVEGFRKMVAGWGGSTKLRELGVKETDIVRLAAMTTSGGAVGKLKQLQQEDIEAILRLAY